MKSWLGNIVGSQLRQPHGALANLVGRIMNRSNRSLYARVIESLHPAPQATVLEIGFGNGSHFPMILRLEPTLRLLGVEVSPEMHRVASKTHHADITSGRVNLLLDHAELLAGSVDTVLAVNVIYFWPNPEENLAEILRLLKPGGRFVIGIRPYETLVAMPFTKTRFILRTESEWREQLRSAGFVLEREEAVPAAAGELPGLVWVAIAPL
ncbi:SmtA SAM-dependent methyltransferases [Fimbriimonadaceae bacterium]